MRGVAAKLAVTLAALLLTGCSGTAAPTSSGASVTTASVAVPTSPTPTTPTPTTPTTAVAAPTTAAAPSTVALPLAGRVIVIDPGHNGGNASHPEQINAQVPDGNGGTKPCNTTGTESNDGYPEHAFTWDTSLRVRDLLATQGATVVLTRSDDTGVGPCVDVRAQIANDNNAAAFVGIHADGSGADNRGFHVITSSLNPAGPTVAAASASLAVHVRDAVLAAGAIPVSDYVGTAGLDSRNDLAGLNLNDQPAIYVECGNMRNASDAAVLSSDDGRQGIAAALAAAIIASLAGS